MFCVHDFTFVKVGATPDKPREDPENQSWKVLYNHDMILSVAKEGKWKFDLAFPLVQIVIAALNKAYPAFLDDLFKPNAIPLVAAVLFHLR